MIRINLQSAGQKKQRRKAVVADAGDGGGPSTVLPLMMLILPIAGGLGGSYVVHNGLLAEIETTNLAIRAGEAEMARLKPILDEIEQFKKDRALLESKLSAIRALQDARNGPVRLYAELAAIMPPQVWVTSVRDGDGNAVIDGFGLDSQSVAVFANAMLRSPYFANVELTSVEQAQYLGLDIKKFVVTCRFQNPANAQAVAQASTAAAAPAGRGK